MNGRELILFPARGLFAAGLLSAVAVAAPAQADVMEIGSDGAQWIAGGPITQSAVSAQIANNLSQAIIIPDRPQYSVSPVMLA